jgi:hypothetical protein
MAYTKMLKTPRRDMDTIHRVRATGRLARSMAEACPFSKDANWFWRLARRQIEDYCAGRPDHQALRFSGNEIRSAAA